MIILMSAFSCGPGQGSEAGIGWNWALEAARLGHDVTVVTTDEYQSLIDREIASGRVPKKLRIHIFSPRWLAAARDLGLKRAPHGLVWSVTNYIWQVLLPGHVRKHFPKNSFDVVHHVTLGTIRHPTCLGRLGLPMIVGPVGGGERVPAALRRTLGVRARMTETLRDAHTWLLRLDPLSRAAFADASAIIARTRETALACPPNTSHKVMRNIGIGTREIDSGIMPRRREQGPFRLIFAGRLLAWKGTHMAVAALARLRAKGIDATLTIAGDGPERGRLQAQAERLGLASHVEWTGNLARADLLDLYANHHAMVFPSMRDSGGMVVLEAFAQGLPVICLALGGPAEVVNATCGSVVPVDGGENEIVRKLAGRLAELARSEDLRLRLSQGALARVRDFSWERIVAAAYHDIEAHLSAHLVTAGPVHAGPPSAPVSVGT